MKVFHVTLTLAAAILCLAGCNKELGRADKAGIIINASIGNLTKVNNDGITTRFTAGDKISVYGWTGSGASVPGKRCVDGVTNTLGSDGSWTPEEKMLWQSSSEKHYFLGVFPVRKITDFTADDYTLDPFKYTESDLLIATNLDGVTAKDGPVDLVFRHAMAKTVVNLKFGTDWDTTPAVSSVSVSAKTAAGINYLGTPVVSAKGDASDVSLAALASAPAGFAYSYSGLQVPQTGVRKITIIIGNDTYVYEAAGDIPLVSGKITTIELVVKGRALVEVGSVTLSDWADGADLPGGAAAVGDDTPIVFDNNNQSMASALVGNPKVNINHDNCISRYEASVVRSLEDLFGDQLYTGANYNSFNEFQYFTGITTIPAGSFKNWNNLTSIKLPESITKIEGGGKSDGPFVNCPKLEKIEGKFTVGNSVIYNGTLLKVAETLTDYTIPDYVKIIGKWAFYKSNVEAITIPSSVEIIRDHAFEYSQLESVTFAMNGTDPATATAYVDSLAYNSFAHCFRLTGFYGPEQGTSTVRVTPDNLCLCLDTTLFAFAMRTKRTEYAIPESAGVHMLAPGVFSAVSSNSSSTSNPSADPSAVQLQKIGLPSTITHIANQAFSAQKALSEVWFKGENPPVVEDGAFNDISAITFYVPIDGTVSQFQNALGNGAACIFYVTWPFADGSVITGTIARKQAYVCENDHSQNIQKDWLPDEHIAILYSVQEGGMEVRKRADARIVSVDDEGVATIRFFVESNALGVPIDCSLIYPYSAAKNDNTGPKSYSDMANSQEGTLDSCLDVHVCDGSFNTAVAPVLNINTPLAPFYGIVKFNMYEANMAPHMADRVTVKSKGNTLAYVTLKTKSSTLFISLPPMTDEDLSLEDKDDYKGNMNGLTVKAGKYYVLDFTMSK